PDADISFARVGALAMAAFGMAGCLLGPSRGSRSPGGVCIIAGMPFSRVAFAANVFRSQRRCEGRLPGNQALDSVAPSARSRAVLRTCQAAAFSRPGKRVRRVARNAGRRLG